MSVLPLILHSYSWRDFDAFDRRDGNSYFSTVEERLVTSL